MCHVIYNGALYNGVQPNRHGPRRTALSIDVPATGLWTGVLLDIPRARGVSWLEPGDQVTAADLEAAERANTSGCARRSALRPGRPSPPPRRARAWDAAQARAGLHPSTLPLLAERGIAALGSDGNNDTAPSTTAGIEFPIHVLAINAIGMQLMDYVVEELVATLR